MPLSDTKLRALKASSTDQKVSDFEGLFVLVKPNGSKLWRLAYRFEGKQKLLALGSYPDVSLREARQAKDAARTQLAAGIDPARERKISKLKRRIAAGQSFAQVANDWFESRRAGWVSSYADRLRSRLDADLLPHLGQTPIASIEPIELLEVVRKIERRGAPEMARRVLQMASAVFRYGVATGRCSRDPTSDLRGALQAQGEPRRRSAITPKELPEFISRLHAYDGDVRTKLALEFILHTFVRTSEARFARWNEFEDLEGDKPLWRIPSQRMKMRRDHLVPLTHQVVTILRQLKAYAGSSEYILPAPTRSKVISENTMLYALYRMGYHGRATVHGFRSTASTALNEHEFNRDWIEMQLAHCEGGVRAIYNAAEWLAGRRSMMAWWSDHLDRCQTASLPGP